ncbi:hypothetical protein JHK85_039469 [Glycine max]|nr:hypothetical protein JHK86_038889 [Glycine max]KAG4964494.1 hypothetical protein JHK85_039469 [Glycine max]KHN12028.1 hypothetical protein glysoja_020001 [Glycine soja]
MNKCNHKYGVVAFAESSKGKATWLRDRDQDVDIISVHHASGLICEINLSNPLSTSDDLRFLGTFHVFSVTGFYNNNNLSASSSPNNNSIPYSSSAIQFTRGSPPKLFEGLIGGKLIGVEPVQVMASIVKKRTCST